MAMGSLRVEFPLREGLPTEHTTMVTLRAEIKHHRLLLVSRYIFRHFEPSYKCFHHPSGFFAQCTCKGIGGAWVLGSRPVKCSEQTILCQNSVLNCLMMYSVKFA